MILIGSKRLQTTDLPSMVIIIIPSNTSNSDQSCFTEDSHQPYQSKVSGDVVESNMLIKIFFKTLLVCNFPPVLHYQSNCKTISYKY